jgi:hypothetical protein
VWEAIGAVRSTGVWSISMLGWETTWRGAHGATSCRRAGVLVHEPLLPLADDASRAR